MFSKIQTNNLHTINKEGIKRCEKLLAQRVGQLTSPEVDDDVQEEDCVRHAVEDNPVRAQIVVEEGYGHG